MTRWQIVSIVGGILIVIAALLLYLNQHNLLRKFYLRLGYERAVTNFAANPVANEDIVFLGDSITAAFPLNELQLPTEPKNRGINGDTTRGVLRRLDQVTAGQPRQIFLMIGTNDLIFGRSKETVVATYAKILRRIQSESPATEVFVQSILPQDERLAADIHYINQEIAVLAEEHGYVYIDLFPDFADEAGGLRPEFTDDGLHLVNTGYKQWQELIRPYLYGGAGN